MSGVWNLWHSTQWCKSWPFRNKSSLGHPFELGFPQHRLPSLPLHCVEPFPRPSLQARTLLSCGALRPRAEGESLGEEEEQKRRGARKGTVLERRLLSWWCNVLWAFCSPWLLLNSFDFGLFSAEVVVVSGGGGHEGEGCSSFTKKKGRANALRSSLWFGRCFRDSVAQAGIEE